MKLRKGRVLKCSKCGLRIDRQLNASINLYLRMWGFPPSPSTFHRVVIKKMIPRLKVQMRRGSGVTLKGDEGNDMPPDELKRGTELNESQGFDRPS